MGPSVFFTWAGLFLFNSLMPRIPYLFLWLTLLLSATGNLAWGVTYLTQEQAIAVAFEHPEKAERHPLIFDEVHRQAIERKLDEKVEQKGVLAYGGALKSGDWGAVLFDAVIGKHEFIDYMVVLNQEGKVKFIEILSYRESYGGQVRNEPWKKQFTGLSEKTPPRHEKNISNISGATLSCRHVSDGVHKLLAIAQVYAETLGLKTESVP